MRITSPAWWRSIYAQHATKWLIVLLFWPAPIWAQTLPFDGDRLLEDVEILSADSLLGRRTGTPGSLKAQRYLNERIQETGISPLGDGFDHPFSFLNSDSLVVDGANFIGVLPGSEPDRGSIVLTAHYDHLGRIGDLVVFNGADDNASGTAALLALAPFFREQPLTHNLIFAWLDGEEIGFRGAKAMMRSGVLDSLNPVLNVNLDMISRNENNELYVAGTFHTPALKVPIDAVDPHEPVILRFGHDNPSAEGVDDWTGMSDHIVFHEAGIPFICFGVEDHPDYHRPTDDFENIDPVFYAGSVETIRRVVEALDEYLASRN